MTVTSLHSFRRQSCPDRIGDREIMVISGYALIIFDLNPLQSDIGIGVSFFPQGQIRTEHTQLVWLEARVRNRSCHQQKKKELQCDVLKLPTYLNETKRSLSLYLDGMIPHGPHVIALLRRGNRKTSDIECASMISLITIVDLLVLVSFFFILSAIRDLRRRRGCPPGPRPLPIIGNLLDIPKESSWLAYAEFSKQYGDIMALHVFGQVIIVLNSVKATKDLLDKRGEFYSDRPVIPFFEMMGWGWVLLTARYGETWRQGRKLLDHGLRPGAVAKYRPMQESKARVLLTRMLKNPKGWEAHVELLQAELMLAMTYGYEVQGRSDRKVDAARQMVEIGIATTLPGALLVNDLPFLRHIPDWLPWFSYKPLARIGRDLGLEVLHPPIQFVKDAMAKGTAKPSLTLENLQRIEKLSEIERVNAEDVIIGASGSIYAAGADSTVAATMSFFLAMALHPEIMRKAQQELDDVTGRDRLPTFEDRARLPFVEAVCREVSRWRPVVPLALPHATTKDDIYEGFLIPKGAIVIGNTWAILHDPVRYPEPETFKPERFLNPDGSLLDDPVLVLAFGYGKRICPGRHFVDTTLFITIASLLSSFNVEKGETPNGQPFEYTYTGSVISRPNSFPCSIVPRGKRAEELIVADTISR